MCVHAQSHRLFPPGPRSGGHRAVGRIDQLRQLEREMVLIARGIRPRSGPGPFRRLLQQHAGGRIRLSADQAAPQVEGDRPHRRVLLPTWRVGLPGQVRDIQPQGGGQRRQSAAAVHPLPARLQPG
jgi:hypothetical protein